MNSQRNKKKAAYKSKDGEEFKIPHSAEAEVAVLGAILLNNKAIYVAEEIVHPDDFFNLVHKRIFAAMLTMERLGIEIDTVGLYEKLDDEKLLEQIGGAAYLSSLTDGLPRTTNVGHYAKIIKDKSALRNIVAFSSDLFHKAVDKVTSVEEVLQNAESQLRQLHEQGAAVTREAVPIKEAVKEALPVLEKVFSGEGMMLGEKTGYPFWDTQLAGWIPGELVILAARPSMGKTALALELVHRQLQKGNAVGIFSLETGRVSLVLRLACLRGHISGHKIRTGAMGSEDRGRFMVALSELADMPLWIDDRPVMRAEEFEWRLRTMGQRHKIRLAVLDYIQLLRSDSQNQNRAGQVTEISMRVKAAARQLGEVSSGTLIALSQLSRIKIGERPRLDHLRESGQLEQDADVVLAIYDPPEKQKQETQASPVAKEIVILKQKNGPIGVLPMVFLPTYMGFELPAPQGFESEASYYETEKDREGGA